MENEAATKYCNHQECLDDQIADLEWIAFVLPARKEELDRSIAELKMRGIHIRCRHKPRVTPNAATVAPLPSRTFVGIDLASGESASVNWCLRRNVPCEMADACEERKECQSP